MFRLLIPGLAALATATAASAFTFTGTMTLQFGGYWDGPRYVDLKGVQIPFVAEYIGPPKSGGTIHPLRDPGDPGVRLFGGGDDITIYRNDNGDGSYFMSAPEFPMPSCLDDIGIVPNGANRRWKQLTMGLDAQTQSIFLIRWKVYWQYQPGLGTGVNAFFPDPPAPNRDWGGYFQVPIEGTYKLTFDFTQIGCDVPQSPAYVAQQFRWPQFPERGEGPFCSGVVQSVFSGYGPTTGTSENLFWYDWDPMDGKYAEDEVEYFGTDPGQEANFLFVITASEGTTETALPTSFQVNWGTLTGGNLGSLWSNDNDRMIVREFAVFSPTAPSVRLMVQGGISAGPIAGFEFNLIARVPSVGPQVTQVIELFNFSTNQWVQFDSRAATTGDSLVQVVVPNNPQQYVSGSNQVRARISYFAPLALPISGWSAQFNQTIWKINRP